MAFSVVDHYIYLASAIEKTAVQMSNCDDSKRDFWRILYINERQVFYTIIPYYWWQIPFFELYEVIKTTCWTYSEVFVSSMTLTLAMRFRQLTNRIRCCGKQHMGDDYWNEIRCHYNILCNLVLKADKILSPFVLVYSFSNMFFLCQKIFTQFEHNKTAWERYYSYYSSIFLLIRFLFMLLSAASVNETSREALRLMREVSNKSFAGLDVITSFQFESNYISVSPQYHRLLDVIHANTVAISGFRFFFVTKGMILTVRAQRDIKEFLSI
jgi:Trehalose receptor